MQKQDVTQWLKNIYTLMLNTSGTFTLSLIFSKVGQSYLIAYCVHAFGVVGFLLLVVVPYHGTVSVILAVFGRVAVCIFVHFLVLFVVRVVYRFYRVDSDQRWALGVDL